MKLTNCIKVVIQALIKQQSNTYSAYLICQNSTLEIADRELQSFYSYKEIEPFASILWSIKNSSMKMDASCLIDDIETNLLENVIFDVRNYFYGP